MSQVNPYQAPGYADYNTAANAPLADRIGFIRNTYLHLAGAIGLFVLLEVFLFTVFWSQIESIVGGLGGFSWLFVLGGFMLVGFIAERWANSNTSRGMQYLGLGLYVVAEAIIFVPLLYMAQALMGANGAGLIASAGLVTVIIFAGLTFVVFVTNIDFSFLRMALMLGGFAAIALIVVSMVFGWGSLGPLFSVAMIVLASGYILYYTSNVLHHYQTSQYVAASLALFSAIALLFWYVLQLLMSLQGD